jgi:hypothetical protein
MRSSFFILAGLLFTVSGFAQFWSLTGNAGTTNSNFVGTTENMPLYFKVNNQWAGFSGAPDKFNVSFGYLSFGNTNPSTGGNNNTAFGAQTLQYNHSGMGNVAIGNWALLYNNSNYNIAIGMSAMCGLVKGDNNIAIGTHALTNNRKSQNTVVGNEACQFNTEGEGITAMGFKALNKNTTGEFNTAFGFQALLINTTGYWNVALGSGSLQWNTTGRFNTAGGNSSMHFNQEGVENTGFGEQALAGNINGSYSTAVGCRALHSVLFTPGSGDSGYGNGEANTAVGYESLKVLTTGSWNVGIGVRALYSISTGKNNAAMGCYALSGNTTGDKNVAMGYDALKSNTTGSNNTAIGNAANVSSGNLTNATAIGYGAIATASDQVVIGNGNVFSIRGYAPWTTVSDERRKKNIKANVPGLNFINKLQPVTYNLDTDKKLYTGFVAQDVEKAAQNIGYDFSGADVIDSNNGLHGLRYSDFVVPLVKAVQELIEVNEQKDSKIALMEQKITQMEESISKYLKSSGTLSYSSPSIHIPDAAIEQNYPNPVDYSTTVKYTLPQTFYSAKITITDSSGKVYKQIPLSHTGTGQITIDAKNLYAGVYFYSLYVDNTPVDTKKMILKK